MAVADERRWDLTVRPRLIHKDDSPIEIEALHRRWEGACLQGSTHGTGSLSDRTLGRSTKEGFNLAGPA
jgi:hypothetical protein